MQSTNLHAVRIDARTRAAIPLPERRLRRYHARHQGGVRSLALRHAYLADLAVSFPALLFALAVPRVGFDPQPVIEGAIAGASLKSLSGAAGLPIWLRRLGPECFVRPIGELPDDALFRRQIANYIPRSPKLAPAWLQMMEDAAGYGNDAIALWVARQYAKDAKSVKSGKLRLVCVWAWFSAQPGTLGQSLIEEAWKPSMQFRTAFDAAEEWRLNLELDLYLGGRAIEDMWLNAGSVDGLEFLPIKTPEAIREEAEAMSNCVRTYGYILVSGRTRLWSIRRDGERIATLQVSREYEDPFLRIVQLKAPKNEVASIEIWQAARRWLEIQNPAPERLVRPARRSVLLDRARWIALWRPYWLAKRRLPAWLPLMPSNAALHTL